MDQVIKKMGFGVVWMGLDLKLLKLGLNVYPSKWLPYQTLYNGKRLEAGDLLSPFLFILVAEVLNKMILRAIDKGLGSRNHDLEE